MHNKTCVRVTISGRVQGVGYRAWTASKAQQMQLSGWVRNRANGTVEAVFCGMQTEIDAMLEACRRGPLLARVDDITREACDEPVSGPFVTRETV